MNYEISKELFEAVMDFKVDNVSITTVYANIDVGLRYERKETLYTIVDCISIDSFFFKCKEWAFEQGYELWSYYNKNYSDCKVWKNSIIIWSLTDTNKQSNEQQAVFGACQWILDHKDKQ